MERPQNLRGAPLIPMGAGWARTGLAPLFLEGSVRSGSADSPAGMSRQATGAGEGGKNGAWTSRSLGGALKSR